MAFREHFKNTLNIQEHFWRGAESNYFESDISCDSLPKTHFVDIQVETLNHVKSIVTWEYASHFILKGFWPCNNLRWHLGVSGLKLENDQIND